MVAQTEERPPCTCIEVLPVRVIEIDGAVIEELPGNIHRMRITEQRPRSAPESFPRDERIPRPRYEREMAADVWLTWEGEYIYAFHYGWRLWDPRKVRLFKGSMVTTAADEAAVEIRALLQV